MTKQNVYDVIVVGSGACGGWAAKELTEAGMHVMVIEAGRRVPHDFLLLPQRIGRKLGYYSKARQRALERQPIQSGCPAWERNPHAFVDDLDNPYATPASKPFSWLRSRQLGGRMVVKGHGLQSYRLSDCEFKAASHDGYGEDWPIEYADLVPYYERIEQWIGVSGTAENIPHLPDSVFVPGKAMTYGQQLLKSAVELQWKDRRVIIARRALLPFSTLPAAMKTGRLTLRSNAVVCHVIVDKSTGKAKGVAFIDRNTHKSHEVFGKVVVLCASTIESTRLLLNSATPQHPEGLGNSSGMLGHFLMDHTYSDSIVSHMPIPKKFLVNNYSFAYIPQFRNITERHPKFIRGYGIQVDEVGDTCRMRTYGEMLPRFENRVTIDEDKKDAWGLPVAHIDCEHSDNEYKMAQDQIECCKEMVQAAGFEILQENPQLSPPGMAIHEVGTARMGNNPENSVLNKFNQSWDVKNLFVTDGACFVSQGCQNPTLTMMAITVRACDYIVRQYKRDNL